MGPVARLMPRDWPHGLTLTLPTPGQLRCASNLAQRMIYQTLRGLGWRRPKNSSAFVREESGASPLTGTGNHPSEAFRRAETPSLNLLVLARVLKAQGHQQAALEAVVIAYHLEGDSDELIAARLNLRPGRSLTTGKVGSRRRAALAAVVAYATKTFQFEGES